MSLSDTAFLRQALVVACPRSGHAVLGAYPLSELASSIVSYADSAGISVESAWMAWALEAVGNPLNLEFSESLKIPIAVLFSQLVPVLDVARALVNVVDRRLLDQGAHVFNA